jgi:hypothetical protein
VSSRGPLLNFLGLLVLALVVCVAAWQAFGWFDGMRNVVIAAVVWAALITGWIELRGRLYDRGA